MIEFNILKKNRKYFAATKDGYKCRILIDENSEKLELGLQVLITEDISVRNKYGVDLVFKLKGPVQKDMEMVSLQVPYNLQLVEECRRLGGIWDASSKVWMFPGFVSQEVEELDEKYNSNLATIELTFKVDTYGDQAPIYVAGFEVARAWDRDSGAKQAKGVALLSGSISSGGSRKNWHTKISEGSVIRMTIPELCIVDVDSSISVKLP